MKRIEQNKAKLAKERENLQEMLRQHELAMIPINKKPTAKDRKVRVSSCSNTSLLPHRVFFFFISSENENQVGRRPTKVIRKGSNQMCSPSLVFIYVKGTLESADKLAPGVMVRSQKLPVLKPSVQAKVAKVLNELSIGKNGDLAGFERLLDK